MKKETRNSDYTTPISNFSTHIEQSNRQKQLSFSQAFLKASNNEISVPKRRLPPFSLRLSAKEKADLVARAGDVPVSAYAKSLLFADGVKALRLSPRNPTLDHQILGQLLAQLGRSEIASDLAVLADAVRSGSLPMDEVTIGQIERSCSDIAMVRTRLMEGLGIQRF